MNLPGSPRAHVWLGLLLALVGVLVGGYAYTSWRIYHIQYLPVALLGLVLVVGGSALAGYGQANRPRLGGRRDEDEPSTLDRIKAWLASLAGSSDSDDEEESEPEAASGEGEYTAEGGGPEGDADPAAAG